MTQFDAIIETDVLVDWLETFQSVVDEARVHIREDGLYAIPVDPANVAMVEQTLHATAFESYDATEFDIGVNLETLQDYVEAGDEELVHLEYNAEIATLEIHCGAVDLEMACIDPDAIRNDGTIPDVFDGMATDVTLDAGAFDHAVSVVGMVSDHVVVDSDPNRDPPLEVSAKGDTDKATVGFEHSLHEGSEVTGEGESLFSLEYLEDLTGAIPKDAELRVRAGDEWPMVMDYEYADGGVTARMMCAPRIRSE